MIDFTNLPRRNKTYGGANGSKRSVIYQDEQYMLKFPPHPSRNRDMSYANSCLSEYLGCHIFNYIKQDGYYYFCDFANCEIICGNGLDYLMYVCQDPLEFTEYYCTNVFPGWDDPDDDNYLVLMYLYPRDGKDSLPRGSSGAYNYLTGGRSCDVISSEVEDTVVILYERDWYHHSFMDVDPDAIPEECHDLIDGVMHTVNWRTGEVLDG